MCTDIRSRLHAEIDSGRREPGGLLKLDEGRPGCGTKLHRLVARGASTARGYLIPVSVEVLLERLHLCTRRAQLEIFAEGRCSSCGRSIARSLAMERGVHHINDGLLGIEGPQDVEDRGHLTLRKTRDWCPRGGGWCGRYCARRRGTSTPSSTTTGNRATARGAGSATTDGGTWGDCYGHGRSTCLIEHDFRDRTGTGISDRYVPGVSYRKLVEIWRIYFKRRVLLHRHGEAGGAHRNRLH